MNKKVLSITILFTLLLAFSSIAEAFSARLEAVAAWPAIQVKSPSDMSTTLSTPPSDNTFKLIATTASIGTAGHGTIMFRWYELGEYPTNGKVTGAGGTPLTPATKKAAANNGGTQWTVTSSVLAEAGRYYFYAAAVSTDATSGMAKAVSSDVIEVNVHPYAPTLNAFPSTNVTMVWNNGNWKSSPAITNPTATVANTGSMETLTYQWKEGASAGTITTDVPTMPLVSGENSVVLPLDSPGFGPEALAAKVKYYKAVVSNSIFDVKPGRTKTDVLESFGNKTAGPITVNFKLDPTKPTVTSPTTKNDDDEVVMSYQFPELITATIDNLNVITLEGGTPSYAWSVRKDADGTFELISGATKATYTPTANQTGAAQDVVWTYRVTAKNTAAAAYTLENPSNSSASTPFDIKLRWVDESRYPTPGMPTFIVEPTHHDEAVEEPSANGDMVIRRKQFVTDVPTLTARAMSPDETGIVTYQWYEYTLNPSDGEYYSKLIETNGTGESYTVPQGKMRSVQRLGYQVVATNTIGDRYKTASSQIVYVDVDDYGTEPGLNQVRVLASKSNTFDGFTDIFGVGEDHEGDVWTWNAATNTLTLKPCVDDKGGNVDDREVFINVTGDVTVTLANSVKVKSITKRQDGTLTVAAAPGRTLTVENPNGVAIDAVYAIKMQTGASVAAASALRAVENGILNVTTKQGNSAAVQSMQGNVEIAGNGNVNITAEGGSATSWAINAPSGKVTQSGNTDVKILAKGTAVAVNAPLGAEFTGGTLDIQTPQAPGNAFPASVTPVYGPHAYVTVDGQEKNPDYVGPAEDTGTPTPPDTGDTGTPPDTGDTGTPPDTGDTGTPPDTGDTGTPPDTGDTGTSTPTSGGSSGCDTGMGAGALVLLAALTGLRKSKKQ